MESKIKPIPAFYCCYLLRSTVRHASLYVGSSPHPARRLAQHNGKVKGGAVRTSRLSLRPWEMTCIVNGFPSNIAALQFEWAWQNAHLSRHISAEDRISFPVSLTKTNARTGKTRKKPGRPRTSLVERLANLHLLLRTQYFARWPLEVRFFNEDVHRTWQSWCARLDSSITMDTPVILDLAQTTPGIAPGEPENLSQRPSKVRKADLIGKGGVDGADPTYARYQPVLEKGQFLLDADDGHACSVCHAAVDIKHDLFVLCTADSCPSVSHMTCLSDKFLREQTSSALLPTRGTCPECQSLVEWSDLMRAMSLRIRGAKEVAALLKRGRKPKAALAAELLQENEHGQDDDEELLILDERDGAGLPADGDGDEEGDDDDDDAVSISSYTSALADVTTPPKTAQSSQRLELVIEDSEDERYL